jgi:hypothetical protein
MLHVADRLAHSSAVVSAIVLDLGYESESARRGSLRPLERPEYQSHGTSARQPRSLSTASIPPIQAARLPAVIAFA